MPKIGASGERTRPSTAPLVSTTEMRDLGAAVERPADLGAGGAHDLERFLEQGAHLGGGQRAPAPSVPARIGIAVGAGAVGQDEGVGIGEFGGGRGADARSLGAVGAAGEDAAGRVVIAAHRGQRAGGAVDRGEGAARRPDCCAKSAGVASRVAQQGAVDADPLGADLVGRGEAGACAASAIASSSSLSTSWTSGSKP